MTAPTGTPANDGGNASNDSTPANDGGQAPKWDGEFDAERAAKLVANLRTDMDKLKAERDELKKAQTAREDAEKSELQKLQERAAKSEEELTKTQRALAVRDAADDAGIPKALRKFITGTTADEIAASAKELAEHLGTSGKTDDSALPGRPAARLVPGHSGNDDAGAFDPEKAAAAIKRR